MIQRHLKGEGRGALVPIVCRYATEAEIAFLTRLLGSSGRAGEKRNALEALFRLGQGKDAALALLRGERRGPLGSAALTYLRKAYRGREQKEPARQILVLSGDSVSDLEPLAYTALVVGGRTMLPEVRAVYARQGANRLFSLRMQWYLRGITLADAVADFQVAGIVPAGNVGKAIADELNNNPYWTGEENPAMSPHVLERLNGSVSFAAECGFFPVNNEPVIRWLSATGRDPLPVRRVYQEAESYPDGDTAAYTVFWQIGERVYRLRFEDEGDWYALPVLAPALNFSAMAEGRTERFVATDTGDQSVAYLFGAPERVEALAKQYGLVIYVP